MVRYINAAQSDVSHDSRWFIWTVVFLIISGVSLVSYIMITQVNDDTEHIWYSFPIHRPKK